MEIRSYEDIDYTALRFNSPLSYKAVSELLKKGVIKSHRELTAKKIKELIVASGEYDISRKTREILDQTAADINKLQTITDSYVEIMIKNGIDTISVDDDDYPYQWKHLDGMPKVIFVKGDRSCLSDLFHNGGVGIVGSREPGSYALYATSDMTERFVEEKIVIISGMALGIDRQAHLSALDRSGKTIAILPGGADVIYPERNRYSYERISDNGLLISEMPPGQKVLRQYFPARNRLISGLSDACLVMEAGLYSGTLHTASFAASQGKELFVLPNNIYYENSVGGHLLIRDGAHILIDADEVIREVREQVGYRYEDDAEEDHIMENALSDLEVPLSDSDARYAVRCVLSASPKNVDEIAGMVQMPISMLLSILSDMEMSGQIIMEKGKYALTIHK